MYPPNSRYANTATTQIVMPDGTTVTYLQRRFVPQQSQFAVLQQYIVTQNDRLDVLAARVYGDPLQFWQLCDANGAIDPQDIVTPGNTIVLTLPEGIPGTPNA